MSRQLAFPASVLQPIPLLFSRKFSVSGLLLPGCYFPTALSLSHAFCTCQQLSSIETIMILILGRQNKKPDVTVHTKIRTESYLCLSSRQLSLALRDDEQCLAFLLVLPCSPPPCSQDNISTPALSLSYMRLCTEVWNLFGICQNRKHIKQSITYAAI